MGVGKPVSDPHEHAHTSSVRRHLQRLQGGWVLELTVIVDRQELCGLAPLLPQPAERVTTQQEARPEGPLGPPPRRPRHAHLVKVDVSRGQPEPGDVPDLLALLAIAFAIQGRRCGDPERGAQTVVTEPDVSAGGGQGDAVRGQVGGRGGGRGRSTSPRAGVSLRRGRHHRAWDEESVRERGRDRGALVPRGASAESFGAVS